MVEEAQLILPVLPELCFLLRSSRGSDTHSSCITENLGAVSPVLLFMSLCEKHFMIQKTDLQVFIR